MYTILIDGITGNRGTKRTNAKTSKCFYIEAGMKTNRLGY